MPRRHARSELRWADERGKINQLRSRVLKLAAFMDHVETEVLAYMSFPKEHRTKPHANNPIERPNGEIKRRTEVVGIFPTVRA